MKKIVALKDKERADEKFHKERTPESETNLPEAQNEKFREALAKKERKNLEAATAKIRAKEQKNKEEEKRRRKEKRQADKLKKHLKNVASVIDLRKSLLHKTKGVKK